jgi:signal transduction histidine kinase
LLLLVLVAAMTIGIFSTARYVSHRRLQAKVRQLEQENAVQRERARIAQDIHDDIGAHMTQISLLTELTRRHLRAPEVAAEHIGQIGRKAGEAIKALDEIVWAANPRNDTVADLLDYAGQYAVNFLQAAGVRCRLDFPDKPPARTLSGEARHGLFLAVKEALHNIVKHARATEVWLRVRTSAAGLEWQVDDNGCGFAAPAPDALADGLRNMRERLERLGGSCEIQTAPGAGVRVTLFLPWKD